MDLKYVRKEGNFNSVGSCSKGVYHDKKFSSDHERCVLQMIDYMNSTIRGNYNYGNIDNDKHDCCGTWDLRKGTTTDKNGNIKNVMYGFCMSYGLVVCCLQNDKCNYFAVDGKGIKEPYEAIIVEDDKVFVYDRGEAKMLHNPSSLEYLAEDVIKTAVENTEYHDRFSKLFVKGFQKAIEENRELDVVYRNCCSDMLGE